MLRLDRLESRNNPSLITYADGFINTDQGSFAPNGTFKGSISFDQMPDITGDNVPEIVTGPGEGGGPVLRIFDGKNFNLLSSQFVFDPDSRTGINVAADNDNIYVGTGAGSGPVAVTYDFQFQEIARQYIGDPNSRNGVIVTGLAEESAPVVPAPVINNVVNTVVNTGVPLDLSGIVRVVSGVPTEDQYNQIRTTLNLIPPAMLDFYKKNGGTIDILVGQNPIYDPYFHELLNSSNPNPNFLTTNGLSLRNISGIRIDNVTPEELKEIILHEFGHVIDFQKGLVSFDSTLTPIARSFPDQRFVGNREVFAEGIAIVLGGLPDIHPPLTNYINNFLVMNGWR